MKSLSPIEQVAGQVVYTRKAVDEGLALIPEKNKLSVAYSEFCNSPSNILRLIANKFKELGFEVDTSGIDNALLKPFENNNRIRLDCLDASKLSNELSKFASN